MLNRVEGVFSFTAAYKQNRERNVLALMPPPPLEWVIVQHRWLNRLSKNNCTLIKGQFIQLQVGANQRRAPVDPGAEQILAYSSPNPFQEWFVIPHDVLTEEKLVFCLRAYLSWDMTKVSYSPIQTCNLATKNLQLGDRKWTTSRTLFWTKELCMALPLMW